MQALAARLTLSLMWLAWASRPSLRALSYHFTYSYDATVSGTAYTDHGKSAVGRPEVRASGAADVSDKRRAGDRRRQAPLTRATFNLTLKLVLTLSCFR